MLYYIHRYIYYGQYARLQTLFVFHNFKHRISNFIQSVILLTGCVYQWITVTIRTTYHKISAAE